MPQQRYYYCTFDTAGVFPAVSKSNGLVTSHLAPHAIL